MGKFSSLLLGAVTGAAAAYFLTSKKGKETTDKVRDFVKEYQATQIGRRRVGKECRSRWSPYH